MTPADQDIPTLMQDGERFREAAEHHRWCWTCGQTQRSCDGSERRCCLDCAHPGYPVGGVDAARLIQLLVHKAGGSIKITEADLCDVPLTGYEVELLRAGEPLASGWVWQLRVPQRS